MLSAGIFWKQIEDFIFLQTIDDFDFAGKTYDEAVIALNGDDADVIGLELNYQQHFGFLGAPWDTILANGTECQCALCMKKVAAFHEAALSNLSRLSRCHKRLRLRKSSHNILMLNDCYDTLSRGAGR